MNRDWAPVGKSFVATVTLVSVLYGLLQQRELLDRFAGSSFLLYLFEHDLALIATVSTGGLLVILLQLAQVYAPQDVERRRGLYGLAIAATLLFFLWTQRSWDLSNRATIDILSHKCWVGYDPLDFDPIANPNPSVESITRDLRWIRLAGFDGIVTFSSQGTLAHIPELAATERLGVIMGVWNPKDLSEIGNAANAKDFVAGYSVGHDGLYSRYDLRELQGAVGFLRGATDRPVTTTENAVNYEEPDDNRLSAVSDWFFPDVHKDFRNAVGYLSEHDIPIIVDQLMTTVRKVEVLSRRRRRPLVVKMLSFPHGGVPGVSPELQRMLYQATLTQFLDAHSGLRVGVTFMVHSAFDEPWKVGNRFNDWDPYTGLISKDGTPRPAVSEILRSCQ